MKKWHLFKTFGMILKDLNSNQQFGKGSRRNFFTMSDDISTMKSAIRVLMAITDRVEPTPTDVAELHRIAPECSDLPLDELACELVQRALKKRGRASGNEMNEANYVNEGGHNYSTLVYEIDLGINHWRFRLTSPMFQPSK